MFKHINKRNKDLSNNNVITNSAEYGLIPQRDFFDKDIAVEGNTENYYIIEKGDFVYNPRKSTTAPYGPFNCYKYDEIGIVSPLYTCLKPIDYGYTNYLLWYFKSPVWYSYIYHNGAQGGARHDRVGMTNELMDGIPINIPCIEEQQKISSFLTLLDEKITKQRELIENLKSYKRGVLLAIFRRKIKFSNNEWKKVKISDVLSYEQPQKYIVDSENYSNKYKTPVLTANKAFVLGYTNEEKGVYSKGDVIIYDDFTMDMKYVSFPFKVKSSTIKMLTAKDDNNLYYMFSLLQSLNLQPESHKRSYISIIEPTEVHIAPIEEQNKIAKFLMSIDKYVNSCEILLNNLEAQKDAMFRNMFI